MQFDADRFDTGQGVLEIIPIHHASLVMKWNGMMIYCDPVGSAKRYGCLSAPTHIVLTHHHSDHFSAEVLEALATPETTLAAPRIVYDQLPRALKEKATMMANGDSAKIGAVPLKAVAMYNTTPERQKFHEQGVGNGYLFDFAGTTVYLASDTEPIPEMERLGSVDIAFFPMNLPFTMSCDQVLECLRIVQPKVAYPFHYRFPFDAPGTDPAELSELAKKQVGTEILLRDWYPDL